MNKLINLVPNPATDKTFVPRPAAQPLIVFSTPQTQLWVAGESCDVLMFPLTGTGNIAPTINLEGVLTGLTGPNGNGGSGPTYAVDFDSLGNVYALNTYRQAAAPNNLYSVNVFAPGATGNIAPIRLISGSNTGFNSVTEELARGGLCLDGSNNIYVALIHTIYKFAAGADGNATSTVFASTVNGEITSLRFDAARQWIWLSLANLGSHGGATESVIAYNLAGVVQRTITVPLVGGISWRPYQVSIGPDGSIYVADFSSGWAYVLDPSANGVSVPVRTIKQLADFGFATIYGVAVDNTGITYTCGIDDSTNKNYLASYATGADGLASPLTKIEGSNTVLDKMLDGITATFPEQLTVR